MPPCRPLLRLRLRDLQGFTQIALGEFWITRCDRDDERLPCGAAADHGGDRRADLGRVGHCFRRLICLTEETATHPALQAATRTCAQMCQPLAHVDAQLEDGPMHEGRNCDAALGALLRGIRDLDRNGPCLGR